MSEGVALDGAASLIDKSLLQAVGQEEETRFFMLETIREYGIQALSNGEEAEKVRQAHAEYYLSLAEQAYHEFDGVQQSDWLKRLEREQDVAGVGDRNAVEVHAHTAWGSLHPGAFDNSCSRDLQDVPVLDPLRHRTS